jgi:hypothetical protein
MTGVSSTAVEDQQRKAIEDELLRIEEGATYSAQSQFEQAKLWRGTNLVLGVPAAALAGVAGATALASTTGRVTAGILALCAAGFGAVMTTLNAARRADQAHVSSNAYLGLRNDARRVARLTCRVCRSTTLANSSQSSQPVRPRSTTARRSPDASPTGSAAAT